MATPQQVHHRPQQTAAQPPPHQSPPAYLAQPKSGPVYKTWTDEEGAVKEQGVTCCTKFKFAVWLSIVALLVRRARVGCLLPGGRPPHLPMGAAMYRASGARMCSAGRC